MNQLLNSSSIKAKLKKLPRWKHSVRSKSIWTEYTCQDFMAAVRMIRRIASLAEKADHHPDMHLTKYKKLKVVLTTHDAGGVTIKDFKLAGDIVS